LSAEADEIWRALAALVRDHRDDWKRAVIAESGLPFSRIRILLRLNGTAMTVKELAAAATLDAPAATVAVNDLAGRGLVVRRTDPSNRRCKLVSLTAAGQTLVRSIGAVPDPAPEVFRALAAEDLAALRSILDKLADD